MYLFTAGRAIEQGQSGQARNTLTKAEGLINRIDAIIRSLRQFTRRAELERHCIPLICANLRGGMGVISHAPPIPAGSAFTANRHRMG